MYLSRNLRAEIKCCHCTYPREKEREQAAMYPLPTILGKVIYFPFYVSTYLLYLYLLLSVTCTQSSPKPSSIQFTLN